ncbi:MAG: hypothetical protein HN348_16675 [Proteobacteria bacterium]|nr:hypothetical protein [Pseudomonadota bacterium]
MLEFPVIVPPETPPLGYGERTAIRDELLDPYWYAALLPVLTMPFVVAGLAFAGVFQRRREHIGQLYGADLVGGAVGAVVFIPALGLLAGPDLVFLILVATAAAAILLFSSEGSKGPMGLAAGLGLVSLTLLCYGVFSNQDILKVKNAAGYAEENVVYSEWTPLARISLHSDAQRSAVMLLDNSSASEIYETAARRDEIANLHSNRTLVYRLHKPPQRVAVLAASAGPEVSIAQSFGYSDIDAIDIAGRIFDIVAEKYPDSPVNPYVHGNTRRIESDGRAAILHASESYDIIQMVHANLWSSAGMLSNAWSPSLLETVEAFETYFDHLSDDGTISFARASATKVIARSATEALKKRGVSEPWKHMFYGTSGHSVLLVKKRPFTEAERDRAMAILADYKKPPKFIIDPMAPLTPDVRAMLFDGPVMTDDRPYIDHGPKMFLRQLQQLWRRIDGKNAEAPLAVLYRSIVIQFLFVMAVGLVLVFTPLLRRGPTNLVDTKGVAAGLLYVSCLGYGYLAVETVLIHELVLFVGHPTYAVTVVILAMLLFSGLGSIVVGKMPGEGLLKMLRWVLATVVVLGAVQAFVVPAILYSTALGLPLSVRLAITLVVLAPLGFVMGMPFPLALRLLRPEAGGIVPWAWALNGWMSVVASLATVMISRIYGYSYAFSIALLAYGLALALAGLVPRIGQKAS